MATKTKSVWHCSECGSKEFKWVGQCPTCGKWNTFSEEVEIKTTAKYACETGKDSKPLRLKDIKTDALPRILTGIQEFDRLVGGGVVPGSLSLIGGEPGIGKSTLMLQLAESFGKMGHLVLYISGEESVEQTSLRAKRLGIETDNLLLHSETNFTGIKKAIDQLKPSVLIVDSIQVVYKDDITSSPGSVTQVRENTAEFMHLAKGQNISTFLIGHVTKSGEIAGPRILEHLVDTVLYFEGDKQHNFRMVRVVKNRFGPTDEIAVFEMQTGGLKEVANPSQVFLEERENQVLGCAVIATLEGSRAILVEVQSLVTPTAYSTPSRKCMGIDQNRLSLLLAVLEKKMRYQLFRSDVFVSIAGGLKIQEPGADLGILLAIASSFTNRIIPPGLCIIGEVGLSGQVRGVTRIESRIKEALHMGFTQCLVPKRNVKGISSDLKAKIQITGVEMVDEAIQFLSS
jgi:DNA repair protein RadA/Sms